VWAEPARSSYDHDVVRVHAATALLRGVPDTTDVRARLAAINRFMSLGALVPSRTGDRIILHSAACFHAQNVAWLQPLFLAAVGIQVADAHIKADGLARLLGGRARCFRAPAIRRTGRARRDPQRHRDGDRARRSGRVALDRRRLQSDLGDEAAALGAGDQRRRRHDRRVSVHG
jgi:hypothetical protein